MLARRHAHKRAVKPLQLEIVLSLLREAVIGGESLDCLINRTRQVVATLPIAQSLFISDAGDNDFRAIATGSKEVRRRRATPRPA